MTKNLKNIKKIRKIVFISFLMIQMVLLNAFTIPSQCNMGCCHNDPVAKPVSHCCSMQNEIQSPASNSPQKLHRQCNCYHAEKHKENYILTGQYKVFLPDFDFTSPADQKDILLFSIVLNNLNSESKTNSPPIYITNSVFII